MHIKRSSWHYKLAYNGFSKALFNQQSPKDLCTYMRQVMKPMLFWIGVSLGLVGACFNVYMMYTFGAEEWVWPDLGLVLNLFGVVAVVIGWIEIVLLFVAILFGFIVLIGSGVEEYVWNPYKKSRASKREEGYEPTPNIFMEWLRAKKQKICPLIEVVGD